MYSNKYLDLNEKTTSYTFKLIVLLIVLINNIKI